MTSQTYSFVWPILLILSSQSSTMAAAVPILSLNLLTKRDHTDEPEEIEEIQEFHDHQHSHMPPHVLALIIVLSIVGTLITIAMGMCIFHWHKAKLAHQAAMDAASQNPETTDFPTTSSIAKPAPIASIKYPTPCPSSPAPESEVGLRGGQRTSEYEPDCSWCYISEKKLCGWCSGENQDPPETVHRRMSSIDGSSMFSGHTRLGSGEYKHSFRPGVGMYTLPSSPVISPINSSPTSPASFMASLKGKERAR